MARGFNKAILVGNLARDPELRYTNSQTPVASFTLAVNRTWRGKNGEVQEQVDFIPIVVWSGMAENCHRYLKKGSAALVEGRIQVRSYEDKQGQKRYVTEIVAETVQFLGGRRDDSNGGRDGYNAGSGGWGAPQGGSDPSESGSFRDAYGDSFQGGDFALDISKVDPADSGTEADIPF